MSLVFGTPDGASSVPKDFAGEAFVCFLCESIEHAI